MTTIFTASPAATPTHALLTPAETPACPTLIWTDGSCRPNPGRGGWAWFRRNPDGTEAEASGPSTRETTNSRMELAAVIKALEALPIPSTAIIHLDSEYVALGASHRAVGWAAAGWRTKEGKPVKNDDLWKRLLAAAAPHQIEWKWVQGHSDDLTNCRVDALANAARLNAAC